MRNLRVEVTAQSLNNFSSLFIFDLFHQTFQCFITFQDTGLGKLTKWHFFSIIPDFFHLIGHHLHIKDQFDQILNRLMQIGLHLRLVIFLFIFSLLLLLSCIILFIIILIVHLNLSISSPQFIIQFFIVLMYSMQKMIEWNDGLLSWNTHSSPTCEEKVFL